VILYDFIRILYFVCVSSKVFMFRLSYLFIICSVPDSFLMLVFLKPGPEQSIRPCSHLEKPSAAYQNMATLPTKDGPKWLRSPRTHLRDLTRFHLILCDFIGFAWILRDSVDFIRFVCFF
jgi:hypothetical protein